MMAHLAFPNPPSVSGMVVHITAGSGTVPAMRCCGAPSGFRTPDPLIKSQLVCGIVDRGNIRNTQLIVGIG